VRFECVRLGAPGEPANGACSLEGTVEDVLFLGNALEVNVRCGEMSIIAHVPSTGGEGAAPGQRVRVMFEPDNATVFHG